MKKIPLARLVSQVRTEIRKLHASTLDPIMEFKECEIEFAVQLETDKRGDIGIYIAKVTGGKKGVASHKIKIKYAATAALGAETAHVGKLLPKPGRQDPKKGAKSDA